MIALRIYLRDLHYRVQRALYNFGVRLTARLAEARVRRFPR